VVPSGLSMCARYSMNPGEGSSRTVVFQASQAEAPNGPLRYSLVGGYDDLAAL
jgi:hypothetical protein